MSKVYRSNRKVDDVDVVTLNSLGLSLRTIGELLGCHTTSVKVRLDSLGIEPSDTRRTFMEDVLKGLSEAQMEWLSNQLGPTIHIKDYVRNLIVEKFLSQK